MQNIAHFKRKLYFFFIAFSFLRSSIYGSVVPGIENLFSSSHQSLLQGKRIGLITNYTAIDSLGNTSVDLFLRNAGGFGYCLAAIFSPEHGLSGLKHAGESVEDALGPKGIPVYSLHGATRRPTEKMLKGLSLLVFDMQDIGSRSYTYISTLFYAMEEAAVAKIPFVVLDRPNPLGGHLVDGPMLEKEWRSFVGYVNVPYCHGMTVGELARYFNGEYGVGCNLTVIPMRGWKRSMAFKDTGLTWIPTSPQAPEADTAFYYPATGLLGELQIVNIGVGYTLPFKVIGAPWIDASEFAARLNASHFPGVRFHPFHYTPFFGRFAGKPCHGAMIILTDRKAFLPVTTQYLILGTLKALYPSQFQKGLADSAGRGEMFNKVCGTPEVLRILSEEKYIVWKLRGLHQKERERYMSGRLPYLIADYPP